MTPNPDPLRQSLPDDELPSREQSMTLLARAQGGDRRALEDLVVRYQERIRRIARIQLRNSPLRRHYDSMDIVQSTYRAALPRINDLRPNTPGGVLHWLSIIATNQIRDAVDYQLAEKRSMKRNEGLDRLMGSSQDLRPLESPEVAPHEQAHLSEIRDLLDDEVAKLPEDQRRAVILRDYCGEEWDRIAAELDRENGAARQLHQRAWITLRRALKPKLQPPE